METNIVNYTTKTGIYIIVESEGQEVGVDKKIEDQLKVLSRYYEMKKIVIRKKRVNVLKRIMERFPGGVASRDYERAIQELRAYERVDFVMVRGVALDAGYIDFFRRLKRINKECRIIFELPTFPYDKELLHSLTMWPWYFKDLRNRKYLCGLVDRIMTYSKDEEIFGVSTINTMNGILVDKISPVVKKNVDDKALHMLSVAHFRIDNGYERIIKSLRDYYRRGGTREIIIDLVGYGDELKLYKRLLDKWKLGEHVFLRGEKKGFELEEYYQKADVALGFFGLYKNGIEWLSPLKTREYLSFGLPIVSGFNEDVFNRNGQEEFYLQFPNDSSDIDMQLIVDFVDNLYSKYSADTLRMRIHEFAKLNIDMEVTLKPLIDYISS